MGAKAVLAAARRSRQRVEALMERRAWYEQAQQCRSGGRSEEMEKLQRALDREIDEAVRQELAAMGQIDALADPRHREVLRYRYLNGWEWKEIARCMGYSPDWVKHMHSEAIRAVEMLKNSEA
jgi:DNA-directed RNA polymerase specialized sigma24 family protein